MSTTLLAFAFSHVSLLSLATLDRRFAWSRIAVHVFVWPLTALTLWAIWAHIDPSQTMLAASWAFFPSSSERSRSLRRCLIVLSTGETDLAKIDAEIEALKKCLDELEAKKEEISSGQRIYEL